MQSYVSELIALFPLLAIYILWRFFRARKRLEAGNQVPALHEAVVLLFAVFIVELLAVSFLPLNLAMLGTGTYEVRFMPMPFTTLRETLASTQLTIQMKTIAITQDLLVYAPLGFLLPLLKPQLASYWRTLCAGLVLSLGIGAIQLIETYTGVSVQTFAVDDVILAVLGATIGYLAFLVVRTVVRRYYPDFRREIPLALIEEGERARGGDASESQGASDSQG